MDISYLTNETSLKRKLSNLTCYCVNVRQYSAVQHTLRSRVSWTISRNRGHDFGFVFILILVLVFVFARIAIKEERERERGETTRR